MALANLRPRRARGLPVPATHDRAGDAAAVIFPAEAELRAFAHAAAHLLVERVPRLQGARAISRRPGVGLQTLDHRDYVPGDEVRHIDWRLSARARKPIVRRHESESVGDWTLLVDASSSMAVGDGSAWRAAARLTAAMAYALLHLGHRVGLVVFGARVLARVPGGRGAPHYAAIARTLAALRPAPHGERSELAACAALLPGGGSVLVISDFLAADEMRAALAALRPRCRTLHALQLRDAAAVTLPTTHTAGTVELVDAETGQRRAAEPGAAAQEAAVRAQVATTARLRAFAARCGVAFSDCDTSDPWQQALLAHLLRAGVQRRGDASR
ncbi:MAG: DUF58 domain-containing protein [Burkholderiaceae bacterium]|jgi:uncharacterized protein (DUF58 family)|nr:DUF58 domain-containing protein [Burkholderiaceae bacterium]